MGRKAPRKRLACRVTSAFTRVFDARWQAQRVLSAAPERLSALRPPLDSGERSKVANPGRKSAPRERDGLFDIVSWAETRCCPHPEERACASASARSNARARVSKDEDGRLGLPSCFETHRSAVRPWKRLRSRPAAMLLSMRARESTNLWLYEMRTGAIPLFPDCYLQWTAQLQRVEPSARASDHLLGLVVGLAVTPQRGRLGAGVKLRQ